MTESRADATPIAREEAPHLMAEEMRLGRRTRLLVLAPLAVHAALMLLAFMVGNEHSCDGGGALYIWAGLASLLAMLALPFAPRLDLAIWQRLIISAGLFLLTAGVWCLAYEWSGQYFMCRLF